MYFWCVFCAFVRVFFLFFGVCFVMCFWCVFVLLFGRFCFWCVFCDFAGVCFCVFGVFGGPCRTAGPQDWHSQNVMFPRRCLGSACAATSGRETPTPAPRPAMASSDMRCVTFNIGAQDNKMFEGPKQKVFAERLKDALTMSSMVSWGGVWDVLGRF